MINLSITKNDISYHFKKNREYYILFMIVAFLSIFISYIVIISSDGYLNLIDSKNKTFYSFVNGTACLSELFWSKFISFVVPMLVIVLLGMNFYLSLFSYVLFGYQFSVFIMTIYSIIDIYGFAGVVDSFLLIIPLNLLFFCVMIFLSVTCLQRSRLANRYKYFAEGYDFVYFLKVAICLILCLMLSAIISFVYPLILKSAIFSIY